jgi:hypothetical protein
MIKTGDTIIPFCIFHQLDSINQNHKGIIVNPTPILQDDGGLTYDCKHPGSGWKHVGTFYAVTPMFRPIPVGMKMFCAEMSDISNILSLTSVTITYGLFNFKPNGIYFITYNQPVIHTVPLYLHKRNGIVFPSFDSTPPGPNWTQEHVSPIFVMISGIVNPKNPSDTKFHCVNYRCLPWDEDNLMHYNKIEEKHPHVLSECVVLCNEAAISFEESEPSNILKSVENMSKRTGFVKKIFHPVIAIVVGMFIVALVLLLYFLLRH